MRPLRRDDRAMHDAGTDHRHVGERSGHVVEEGLAVSRRQRSSGAAHRFDLVVGQGDGHWRPPNTPEAFTVFVNADITKWLALAGKAGIRLSP
jgi:hypothetical protein